jgi:integration host factor subunit alpha
VVFKPSAIMKQQINSQPPGSGAVAGAETRSSLAGG